MSLVLPVIAQCLHIGLMLASAPLAAGVLDWADARLTGSAGPPALLPWRDLLRLWRKTPVTLETESVVTRLAPAVSLAATLAAAALVPSFTIGMALSPLADVIALIALLSLGRVAIALAAFDGGAACIVPLQTGSALAVLAEPALMLAVLALALMGGGFNLDTIILQQREGVLLPAAASAVAVTAMLALVFADMSQARPDVMFGGQALAMVRLGQWLRHLIWVGLIGSLFLPAGIASAEAGPLAWLVGLGFWLLKLAATIAGLTLVRSVFGQVPRQSLPDLLGVAALLALLALIMVLTNAGPA